MIGEVDTRRRLAKPLVSSHLVIAPIAFANTYGGRIYVGANDDGVPQGETEVCRIFQSSAAEAVAQQICRLKSLIREKVKPVPAVDVRQITLGIDPVVIASVGRGENPPYATHQNQIYVRKGATSRIPDPNELRSLITSTDLKLNSGIFSNY